MNAKLEQFLSDTVLALEGVSDSNREIATALAELRERIDASDRAVESASLDPVVKAINDLRLELHTLKANAPDDGFELVTTHTYDKLDRIETTITRRVRTRR